eukprot:COSAG06_NODE_7707_length_2404_cov_2.355748_1_plen_130_part_00
MDGGAIEAAMVEGPGAYHMGLVDILQKWDWNKKAERCFKTTVLRKNKDGLSAIEPFVYQRRCEKHASVEPDRSSRYTTLCALAGVSSVDQRAAAAGALARRHSFQTFKKHELSLPRYKSQENFRSIERW